MKRYILVSIAAGFLFASMDAVIHANPWAVTLLAAFTPIARSSMNFTAGMIVDLAYGFIMAGLFCLLYGSLPGNSGLLKGASFGVIAWFFRVAMSAASQWVMFEIPGATILYLLIAGLCEMLVLGLLFGLALMPSR